MPQFTVLLHAPNGKETYQEIATKDAQPRISKAGHMLPSVKVFHRQGKNKKWRYWLDVMWRSCGTQQPTTGFWARRDGTYYFRYEVCRDSLTEDMKRKLGAYA